ncbi:eCIS core domain-containing protein [Streptomyces sp. EMB26]
MQRAGRRIEGTEAEQPARGTAAARRETSSAGAAVPPPLTADALRAAQGIAGNAAVTGMIARRARPAPAPEQLDTEVPEVLNSGGKQFGGPMRQEMESRFGTDFSDVRLHTGPAAARSARAVGARAYTSGNHVVLGPGGGDKHTLAHELTHVVQQRQGPVSGTDHGNGLKISHPSDRFERAAEANARRVMSGPAPTHHDVDPGPRTPAAETAAVQRALEDQDDRMEEIEAGVPAEESPTREQEAALDASEDAVAVMVRLSASIPANAVMKKRKFNIWEPHKQWPEKWLPPKTRVQWALERRLVRGLAFGANELRDIEFLSKHRPDWLNDVGIGTVEDGKRIAEGKARLLAKEMGGTASAGKTASGKGKGKDPEAAEQERADYSTWLKLKPGQRILAATLAFQTQAPAGGAPTPINPAYTLGRFMRTNEPNLDGPERARLENERNQQIRETALDTLVPDSLREEQMHPSAGEHVTEDMKGRDDFARNILTNVLLILRQGLQVAGKDKDFADYKDGDIIRALAHGGRVNIRIPALRQGESTHQLLDFLGVTSGGVRDQRAMERPFATHRSSIGKNKDGKPGSFKEQGGVGASLKNMASTYTPGMHTEELIGVNLSGGGLGTKDWNGDVVLPNGSYGHMLLVFNAPTGDRDGGLLVGIETVEPHGRSPVGYHHGAKSTEATANPESVLHGHKPDKIGDTRVELGRMGGGDWHGFLQTIKEEWADKLEAAKDAAQKRKLYEELVGPRP